MGQAWAKKSNFEGIKFPRELSSRPVHTMGGDEGVSALGGDEYDCVENPYLPCRVNLLVETSDLNTGVPISRERGVSKQEDKLRPGQQGLASRKGEALIRG